MTFRFEIFERRPSQLGQLGNVFVGWDECDIGRINQSVWTCGVATCLVVTLYDPKRKIGALTHITDSPNSPKEFRPENVIDTMLKRLEFNTHHYKQLEATLAGEGYVPNNLHRSSSPIVKTRLNYYNIPIIGEDLGPALGGRFVFLYCNDGKVCVYRRGPIRSLHTNRPTLIESID